MFELQITIAYGEYIKFVLPANAEVEIDYPVKNDGYTSRPKLLILKQGIDTKQEFKSSYDDALKTGFMFYYDEYIDIPRNDRN